MKYLTLGEYQSMSSEEKLSHYQESPVITETKTFMNPKAKTDDTPEKKAAILHRAVCGGIIVSPWKATEKEALQEAVKCIAAQMGSLLQLIEMEQV